MRISILRQREPFNSIFSKTLTRYLSSKYNNSFELSWNTNLFEKSEDVQHWYCNDYINAIFSSTAKSNIFKPLRQEFSNSLVKWRKPFQRAYVILATSRVSANKIAQSGFYITPGIPDSESLLIIPGNHKIRILDFPNKKSISVLKTDYNESYLVNEISTRRLAEQYNLPVPKVGDCNKEGQWFEEELVFGVPANRLISLAHQRESFSNAYGALQKLYQETLKMENLNTYVNEKCDYCLELLKDNTLISETKQETTIYIINKIRLHLLKAKNEFKFETVLSHGDFQPANLLVNDNKVMIIDWEFSEQRFEFYDLLTYALEARYPNGLEKRLNKFIHFSTTGLLPENQIQILAPSLSEENQRLYAVLIFCLENLLLNIQENSNIMFFQLDQGFLIFIKEVFSWLEKEPLLK